MRRKPAVIVAGLVGAAVVAGLLIFARCRRDAAAERLLRDTFEQGVKYPVQAEVRTRMLTGGGRQSGSTTTTFVGRKTLVTVTAPSPSALLDDAERVWRLDDRTATPVGPSERQLDWPRFARNYATRGGGPGSFVGRQCREVRVISRRSGRTAETLWIDPDTYLILARESYDADGHLVRAGTVTGARFHEEQRLTAEMEQALARRPAAPPEVPLTDEVFAKRAGFTPLRPGYVPPGYQEVGLFARRCPHGRSYAERVYCDGLRVLTVHQRPGGGPGGGQGRGFGRRHGQGQHAEAAGPALIDEGQAKTVRVARGRTRVFVTGDLTQAELLRVANSLP